MMKKGVSLFILMTFFYFSCYNTYHIPKEELLKLQSSEEGRMHVNTIKNQPIEVKSDSRLFVRSKGGKRYQITPFNFNITESQLVASDRDHLLSLEGLRDLGEIDKLSTWKTASIISLGAAGVTGLIIIVILTSGEKRFEH